MKHLKIYFAILFFSFLGGANVELMAQGNKLKTSSAALFQNEKLVSTNNVYSLEFRKKRVDYTDVTTLGVYTRQGEQKIWEIPLENAAYVKVLRDGNLVARDVTGNTIWETGTAGRGGDGTHLQIQNDGNLVLYNGSWSGGDGDALWATGTCGGVKNGCGETGVR